MAATGTSVATTSADGVKKVMPPLRTCASMSVSPPSWLFGKILISTRPLVSLAIAFGGFLRADVERMRERQVVAVFQREFGGARDARHGADKAGGGQD